MPDWKDRATRESLMDVVHPTRRSGVGSHDIRFIGLSDLLFYANGASVIDIGCNRGHIGYEFYTHGARLVHGCDLYAPGIQTARHWFAELTVESKFEVVDLTKAGALHSAFGNSVYDIVLFVGVLHKLKRLMNADDLIYDLGTRAIKYLGWNGYADDLPQMDNVLAKTGLRRIHTSEFAAPGIAAIWKR